MNLNLAICDDEIKDIELLKKINEEKNVLFTKKSIKLRKKNGFWLPKEE